MLLMIFNVVVAVVVWGCVCFLCCQQTSYISAQNYRESSACNSDNDVDEGDEVTHNDDDDSDEGDDDVD